MLNGQQRRIYKGRNPRKFQIFT